MDAALHTRCPACFTVFKLEAGQLAQAGGIVQCGSCRKVFNTLAALFDDWPSGDSSPAKTGGMPPVLPAPSQGSLELPEPELDELLREMPGASCGRPDDDGSPLLVFDETTPPPTWHRRAWQAAAAALLLVLVVHLVTMDTATRSWLFGGDSDAFSQGGADAVQLVSRDLHRHPGLDDAVIVSATLVNRAPRAIPFPTLEIRLFDASQQIIGVRRLSPAEYLANEPGADTMMEPEVMVPVLLELVAAGGDPHGFEFRFF